MEKIYEDLVQFTEFMPSVDLALHQYLLMGDEAILIQTGTLNYSKELIPKLKEVLDGKNLKYIYVSHFESDECGGLSEILKAYPKTGKVLVQGVNIVKKHQKANKGQLESAIIEKEAAINSSKVMLYCNKCKNATRISNKILDDGTKVRVCKKCGETF